MYEESLQISVYVFRVDDESARSISLSLTGIMFDHWVSKDIVILVGTLNLELFSKQNNIIISKSLFNSTNIIFLFNVKERAKVQFIWRFYSNSCGDQDGAKVKPIVR